MKTTVNKQQENILILDDDRFFLEYAKKTIENYSKQIDTTTCTNKSEFIKIINTLKSPNLILLDYNLGFENENHCTAHEILNELDKICRTTPVLLISGESNIGLLEEYNKYRRIEFIVKDQTFEKNLFRYLNKLNPFKTHTNC